MSARPAWRILVFTLAALGVLFVGPAPAGTRLPEVEPEAAGFDRSRLERVDDAIERAIAADRVPGAVLLVARHGKIARVRAFGQRAVVPHPEPMTRDTVFDLASLTKPVATAAAAMVLIERGALRLEDRVARLLPEFDNHGKGAITVEQLLRHRAGFVADDPLSDFADGPERAWERIARSELMAKLGERFVYSDVGFMVLGRLVEKVAGQGLDRFAHETLFEPLGMADTGFRPIGKEASDGTPLDRIAPTEKEGDGILRGVVHDPRARALGGVAGHAGLFGTADDLAVFAQMILDGGRGLNGRRVLAPLTVRLMTDPDETPSGQRRGLGWDVDTPYSAPRGSLFGTSGVGHTGFTGTSLWIDFETETIVILLTSRLHPEARANINPLRAEVATRVAAALVDAPARPSAPAATPTTGAGPSPGSPADSSLHPVACGIDVLVGRGFEGLHGKRVGLVTNHTGRTRDGRSTIDVLFHAPGVRLVALFSPEHGIRGAVDAAVADSKDEATGLPIFSLYGATKKPTPASLEGVDLLVFDIQDIGARFYTYITTLGLVLEAAKERGIPLWVLDRPNPIGGVAVAGPVRDPEFASFIAYHALPVRHGMTVGELAQLYNTERSIGAELKVVACEGWRRADLFDRTGLEWVNPSPNIRTLTEALLYPGVCLLEQCNLAHGRGTDTPFERVGAPWIEPRRFAEALNGLGLPGVRFVPIRFTPTARQHAGTECGGVQVIVMDWSRIDPLDVGIGLAVVLRRLYRDEFDPRGLRTMLADQATYEAVLAGRSVAEVRAVAEPELAAFRRMREKYLIYKSEP